jgi:DNA segregation ATPase FtsK/SpoIIIE-like protein
MVCILKNVMIITKINMYIEMKIYVILTNLHKSFNMLLTIVFCVRGWKGWVFIEYKILYRVGVKTSSRG